MKFHLTLALLCFLVPSTAWAQRDPPVWECYLPSITITHAEKSKLALDLVLKKETGPVEHREHQMYLIGYLKEDEAEILKISSDVSLLNKSKKKDERLFLDALIEKELVTVIDTQVGKRQSFAGQDVSGKYADGSSAGRNRADFLKLNTFPFSFEVKKSDLFDAIAKLKHFQPDKVDTFGYFKSKFKLLAFVPVNDCKYATKVAEGIRGKHDFPHFDDRVDAEGQALFWSTPILYFRPLPYEFQFRKDKGDAVLVYIN